MKPVSNPHDRLPSSMDVNVKKGQDQQAIYSAQDAVKDAIKNGGDAKEEVATLLMYQGAFNENYGRNADSLDATKKYMDSWLQENGVDSSKFDDALSDLHDNTPGAQNIDPAVEGSLEAIARALIEEMHPNRSHSHSLSVSSET